MRFFARTFVAFALLFTAATSGQAGEKFYRIIDGEHPAPSQVAIDRFIYGSEVLYTGDVKGPGPVKVDGVVWHSNLRDARYFLGTRNPVIESRAMLELLEDDKWEESKLLMKHAADAYPKTENMRDVLRALGLRDTRAPGTLTKIMTALRHRYADGYFLKPISGFNSSGTFPTERSDFVRILEAFERDVKPRIEQLTREGADSDTIHLELRLERNYEGRVLETLLQSPEKVIIQEKVQAAVVAHEPDATGRLKPIVEEYRVHVVEGRVLTDGTLNRWSDARSLSPARLRQVEVFAQSVIDRLPPEVRRLCFGMDVMATTDGHFKVIELNSGGESGYLYPEDDLWVPQLLAERFSGKTRLQKMVTTLQEAKTLETKEAALDRIIERPELKEILKQGDPLSEILLNAKSELIELLEAEPTPARAREISLSIQKFGLEPYLNASELERLGSLLHQAGIPGARLGRELALFPGELVFVSPTGARLLHNLTYNDAWIEARLAAELSARVRQGELSISRLQAEARAEIERKIITQQQARARPGLLDQISRRAPATLAETTPVFYAGSRAGLLRRVLGAIVRH